MNRFANVQPLLPVLIALALGACGMSSDRGEPARSSVFDDPELPRWELGAEPILEIGGLDEREGYALHGVAGAVQLDDRLLVGDRGSAEVRVFSLTGELVLRSGRSGGGPGEYRSMRALASAGDSVVIVWDNQLRRFTRLDPANGNVLATVTPDLSGAQSMAPEFIGVLGGGSFVFRDARDDASLRDAATGERRDSVNFLVLDSDGSWKGTGWQEPGAEVYFTNDANGWGSTPVVFGRSTLAVTTGSGLVVGATDSLHLTRRGPNGTALRASTLPTAPVPVLREWERRERERLLEQERERTIPLFAALSGQASDVLQRLKKQIDGRHRALPARGTLPAFSELVADAQDQVWVAESVSPEARSRRWIVLDTLLLLIATIEIPRDIQILHIRGDRLAALVSDELGLQTVRVYRIVR